MQEGLGLSNTQAGGLATANLAGYLAMAIFGGRWRHASAPAG
jgi:hypothetical protein